MNNLKKLMLITFISLTAFACSSDDDSRDSGSTTQNQANIIGTWKFTSSTTNEVIDTDNDPCLTLLTVTFNTTQITTIDVFGDNCDQSETYTNNYSISENIISVTDEGETYTSEIITLNSTTLTIQDVDGGDTYTETYTKQ